MRNHRSTDSLFTLKLIFSFAAIYLIWGTTYLAMRVAVHSIPPFLMASSRFLFAGSLLFAFLRFRGVATPTLNQWKSALIVGSLLFLGGNGLVTWAEQEIPSGIAALVVATLPVWMTLFDWLFFNGPKPSVKVAIGIFLGLLGIMLLIGPDQIFAGETELDTFYMCGLVCAPVFWSLGSLYCRGADLPSNVFMVNASQMLCGGVVVLMVSLVFNEPFQFELTAVSREAWLAMVYLTIFGSMIALTAYTWLLKNASASKVATYSYVNPIIAVFLGWLILSESVSMRTGIAVAVVLTSVILIVTDRKSKPSESGSELDSEGPNAPTDSSPGTSSELELCDSRS